MSLGLWFLFLNHGFLGACVHLCGPASPTGPWQRGAKSPWCVEGRQVLFLFWETFRVFAAQLLCHWALSVCQGTCLLPFAGPLWCCHLSSCWDFHLALANTFPSFLVPVGCLNLHCPLMVPHSSSSHTLIDWSNFQVLAIPVHSHNWMRHVCETLDVQQIHEVHGIVGDTGLNRVKFVEGREEEKWL